MGFWEKVRRLVVQTSRSNQSSARNLPKRELAPVAEIVEQGVLVADVAVRMTVKNAIIMDALKRKEDYDGKKVRELVRKVALDLALERENDASRIRDLRRDIQVYGRATFTETEYGRADDYILEHREKVYLGIAEQLQAWADDKNYLDKSAVSAWEQAWAEIGSSLAEMATHPYYSGDHSAEYQERRKERIEAFATDLQNLVTPPSAAQPRLFSKLFGGRKQDAK
ncbi:asparagine synthase [Canibacter zhoujuaniae]|uniref:asparagine synthase n=1 Tax=Canibacter zhoujuaniae TaxID=2708343 RepID=UPI00141EC996|nr:asparagine synthase [Canibacter zhoujuaniae]